MGSQLGVVADSSDPYTHVCADMFSDWCALKPGVMYHAHIVCMYVLRAQPTRLKCSGRLHRRLPFVVGTRKNTARAHLYDGD